MDIKRKNELLNLHLGGIVQIDERDGQLKPWQDVSQNMMKQFDKNQELIVVLTLEEAIKAVKNLCNPNPNASWKEAIFACSDVLSSFTGSVIDAYGIARITKELSGHFGVKATEFIDKYGNRSIKLTGRTGVRKFLTAAKYGVNHWKVIDMGIGSVGVKNSIIEGSRKCIIVAAAYRFLELWLKDQYDIYDFLGNITMDMAKAIVSTTATVLLGEMVATTVLTSGVSLMVVAIGLFAFGFAVAALLYYLDNEYKVSEFAIKVLRGKHKELNYIRDPLMRSFGIGHPMGSLFYR